MSAKLKRRDFITCSAARSRGRSRRGRSRPTGCGVSRAEERGRRRSQGEGPTFCIHGGACSIGLGRWPQFANGDSLGWRQRQSGIGFCQRIGRLQPDVIFAQVTPVTIALKRETRTIPIVFATVLAKRRAETYDCVETC
jgi:hypothetical protein